MISVRNVLPRSKYCGRFQLRSSLVSFGLMCSRTFYIILLLLFPFNHAAIHNVTIDDTFGDSNTGAIPTYLPQGQWQHPDCVECAIKPPLRDVFMRTYSALTYNPELPSMSIQFSFQGIAIYVYFILPNFVADGITTETLCNFTLDGDLAFTFHHLPTSSLDYEFNSLVFSKTNLPNKSHTLLISTSGVDRDLFTSFDYAIYQYQDTIDSTTSQAPTKTVVDPPGPATVTSSTSTEIISSTLFTTSTSHDLIFASDSVQTSSSSSSVSSHISTSSRSRTIIGSTSGPGTLVTTGSRPPDKGTVIASVIAPSTSSSSMSVPESSNSINDDDTTHKVPIGAIVGGTIGGVAFLFIIIIILLFFLCRRRRRTQTAAPSTTPEPKPRYPVLVPFTPSSPGHLDFETRAVEARLSFTPIMKQRHLQHATQTHHSPSTTPNSDSDLIGAQRRSMIAEEMNNFMKELDASSNRASGPNRSGRSDMSEILQQNRVMKAEIERLQFQLNEVPPVYPGYADETGWSSNAPSVPVS